MNVKIQGGGGGVYGNTGSSYGAMEYLNHENDKQKAKLGQIEPFFDHKGEKVDFATAITELDQNRAKLCAKDAKFFAITISPSEKELSVMGHTEEERSKAMKAYTRQTMDEYAKNFGKGLKGEDLLYYAKIHHNRGEKEGMHAHVIVSRKDRNNKIRLSPKTNHRKKSGKINGFDRTNFFKSCEDEFDKKFNHTRAYEQSFVYQNAMKNGTFQEKEAAVKQSELTPNKTFLQDLKQERLRQEQKIKEEQSLEKPKVKKEVAQEQSLEKPKQEKESKNIIKPSKGISF